MTHKETVQPQRKKRGLRLLYLAICMLFAVYLLLANTIVLAVTGRLHDVEEVDPEIIGTYGTKIHFNMGEGYATGSLIQGYVMTGWAFTDDQQLPENPEKITSQSVLDSKNRNKRIELYLVSEKHALRIVPNIQRRHGLYDTFFGKERINGSRHGFYMEFSTIKIPNGTYSLYVYDYENEDSYAMMRTNKVYVKDRGGFRPVK